jgi:Protein of unknown function (DUF3551)
MRVSTTLFATVVSLALHASAEAAPWCAWMSGGRGFTSDCSYYTFEQCLATIRGLGGYCAQNVYSPPQYYGPPRRSRRVRLPY